ncbi:uncharacterized protein LOC126379282 [Pectinophora gossypiella]|uniref:uncharacterized protein LOC126379282 n=1 Tax=Pectinophora gossypiella TaxID=13191 RepID=UPI00214E9E4D|nr:uncharacterized protein LOC126379282 [Pectinophora gossypiella]
MQTDEDKFDDAKHIEHKGDTTKTEHKNGYKNSEHKYDYKNSEHKIDIQKKNAINVQKSLEILEITDVAEDTGVEVSFERKSWGEDDGRECEEHYRTPSDYLQPLTEAVTDQIDQLICKLNECHQAYN